MDEEESSDDDEEITGGLLPQDLTKLKVDELTPLTPEVISRQVNGECQKGEHLHVSRLKSKPHLFILFLFVEILFQKLLLISTDARKVLAWKLFGDAHVMVRLSLPL